MATKSPILISEDLTLQNGSSASSVSVKFLDKDGEYYNFVDVIVDVVVSSLDVSAYAVGELIDIVEWVVCVIIGKKYSGIVRHPPRNLLRKIFRNLGVQIPAEPLRALAVSIEEFILRKLVVRHEERRARLVDVYDPEYQATAMEAGLTTTTSSSSNGSSNENGGASSASGRSRVIETPVAIDGDRLVSINEEMAMLQEEYDKLMGGTETPIGVKVTPHVHFSSETPMTVPSTAPPPPPPPPPMPVMNDSDGGIPNFNINSSIKRINKSSLSPSPSSKLHKNGKKGNGKGKVFKSIGDVIKNAHLHPLRAVPGPRTPGGTILKRENGNGSGRLSFGGALRKKFEKTRRSSSRGFQGGMDEDENEDEWESADEEDVEEEVRIKAAIAVAAAKNRSRETATALTIPVAAPTGPTCPPTVALHRVNVNVNDSSTSTPKNGRGSGGGSVGTTTATTTAPRTALLTDIRLTATRRLERRREGLGQGQTNENEEEEEGDIGYASPLLPVTHSRIGNTTQTQTHTGVCAGVGTGRGKLQLQHQLQHRANRFSHENGDGDGEENKHVNVLSKLPLMTMTTMATAASKGKVKGKKEVKPKSRIPVPAPPSTAPAPGSSEAPAGTIAERMARLRKLGVQ